MKSFYSILILFQALILAGQETRNYEVSTKSEELLTKSFDDLEYIPLVDTLNIPCCDLRVLALFETGISDSVFVSSVLRRAQEITERHFEEGNAIFILNSITDSVDVSYTKWTSNDSVNIHYLTFYDFDPRFVTIKLIEGIEFVNQTTLKLLEGK